MLNKIPKLFVIISKVFFSVWLLVIIFVAAAFYISEYWGTGLTETPADHNQEKQLPPKTDQKTQTSQSSQLAPPSAGVQRSDPQLQTVQLAQSQNPSQSSSQNSSETKSLTTQSVLNAGEKPGDTPIQNTTIKSADERAKKLLNAVQELLKKTAEQRQGAEKLPSREDYLVAVPPWTETKEDKEDKIRNLLDAALQIVTDSPIVDYQKQLSERRKTISVIKAQIYTLRERRIDAPKDSLLPAMIKETVASIDDKVKELHLRISENEKAIAAIKVDIRNDFKARGIDLSEEQVELLMGSVIGNDLVKLVAAFEAARIIDERLGKLMAQNNESLDSARRYFAMHAALYAMLLHAQNEVIHKIDKVYLTKLQVILTDIKDTRAKTEQLMRDKNRPDQHKTLLANRKAQDFAEQVAVFYRDYLITQRDQIQRNRERTVKDLSIADNTFATVEASFQLRSLIEDSKASFKALEKLEAPGFGPVFQNEDLRREFEKLTEKLAVPSS